MSVLLAATVALPFALSLLGLDYLDPRNLIVAVVPALTLLAIGFAAPSRPRLGGAAAIGLCVTSLAVVALRRLRTEVPRRGLACRGERPGAAAGGPRGDRDTGELRP